jgi:hypothetical protein
MEGSFANCAWRYGLATSVLWFENAWRMAAFHAALLKRRRRKKRQKEKRLAHTTARALASGAGGWQQLPHRVAA